MSIAYAPTASVTDYIMQLVAQAFSSTNIVDEFGSTLLQYPVIDNHTLADYQIVMRTQLIGK
jgi:hypothetical protein